MDPERGREQPLVSIITPAKNRADFLRRNMESIRRQTYSSIEHIVIDGDSRDSTKDLLKEQEAAYRLRWISEPDRNHADAYNKGIQMAEGAIIGFLNADDYYTEEAVARIVKGFQEHPDANLIYGNILYIDRTQGIERPRNFDGTTFEKLLFREGFLPQQSLFYTRDLIQRTGLMDVSLNYLPELEWWFRMYRLGIKPRFLNVLITKAVLHEGSISIRNRRGQIEEIGLIYRRQGVRFFSIPYSFYLAQKYLSAPMEAVKGRFPPVNSLIRFMKRLILQ